MRIDLWASQREKAEVLETGDKVLKYDIVSGKPCLLMWNPKATKPFANYSFKTHELRDEYIAKAVAVSIGHAKWKAERKAERAGTADDMAKVQIGDIFCNSWGYDQTNVDYYQVTAKSNRSVTIREIGCKSVPGSGVSHGMADRVVPSKDAFLDNEKPMKKVVYFSGGQPYLPMKHGSCSKVNENEQHYRSWYA